MDKLYISHYYYPGTDPWKNIMHLPEEEAFRMAEALSAAHPDTTSFGRGSRRCQGSPALRRALWRRGSCSRVCAASNWLQSIPSGTYDGLICSNVVDVIPPETAEEIIRESARVLAMDGSAVIGLNYYLSPEAAAARNMDLADGNRLYLDGVLRLVSRTDEEWARIFSPWYTVERLEHFAWPGEAEERRRLFWLKKRQGV